MPVRRIASRRRRWDVSPLVRAILSDEEPPKGVRIDPEERYFHEFHRRDPTAVSLTIEEYWRMHGDEVLADWMENRPGSRPRCWWEFSSPRWARQADLGEPRLMVGGSGIPDHETREGASWHFALSDFHYGIPLRWQHNAPPAHDMPIFESEPTYLERHGLLTPAERRQLVSALDWEPEPLPPDWIR